MSVLGNILWFIFGGLIVALLYFVAGLVLCITIIGIPFGLQLIKLGGLALCPFGRDVELLEDRGCLSIVFNLLWVVFGWWEIALVHLLLAALCCITVVGIPFALAHFRLMKMSLFPFGARRI